MHTAERLLEEGYEVVGVDNNNDYYDVNLKYSRQERLEKHDEFHFHELDLADASALQEIFNTYTITVVINLAAQAGVCYSLERPDKYIQSNIVGFSNILEMCRHHQVEHLIYASSSSVYGANKKCHSPRRTG